MDVVHPALEAAGQGALVRGAWRTGEAMESGVLEVLTLRRERDWAGLAQRVELLRKARRAACRIPCMANYMQPFVYQWRPRERPAPQTDLSPNAFAGL